MGFGPAFICFYLFANLHLIVVMFNFIWSYELLWFFCNAYCFYICKVVNLWWFLSWKFSIFFFILPKISENYQKFWKLPKCFGLPKIRPNPKKTEKTENRKIRFRIDHQNPIQNKFGFGSVRAKTEPIRPNDSRRCTT